MAAVRLAGADSFPPPPAVTPLAASVIATPTWVPGSDERQHVVYEVALLNTSTSARRIDRVEVLTGKGRLVLAQIGPDAVRAIMTNAVDVFGPIDVLPPSAGGLLWLDVSFERASRARELGARRLYAPGLGAERVDCWPPGTWRRRSSCANVIAERGRGSPSRPFGSASLLRCSL